jgi:DNA repair exonuclease SbcCD ATPase subunit
MKKYIILGMITALFACNTAEKKKAALADSLSYANKNMNNELKEKDSLIVNKETAMNEFITSFNEIQANLNQIKEKERIISQSSKETDFKKSNKDQINSDIQLIYDLLNKNKQKVASLTKKLKSSNLKVEELELAVTNLTNQLVEKETEIADLKTTLEALNVDFANLKTKYNEEKEASDQKTEKLNTAYYIVGTTKELRDKDAITKEGGFIGLGKVVELNTEICPTCFTRVDITKTKSIPVKGKKVSLVTSHPANSYRLVEGASAISKLEILDPEQFWSISKYLIVVTDKKS